MSTRYHGRLLLGWVLFAAAAASSSAADTFVVTTQGNTFVPANLTIAAGDSVTFTNGGGYHNVVAPGFRCANGCDGQGGDGDPSNTAWSFTVTFDDIGTVNYICELHVGLGMVGSIVVEPASGGGSPGTLALSMVASTVSEGGGSVVLPVTRSGGSDGQVTVDYATVPGTAQAGLDFMAVNGTLTWEDGDDDPIHLEIPILDDGETEVAEVFELALSNPGGGAVLGTYDRSLITIEDDDTGPPSCVEDDFTLCLNEGRFKVQIAWRDFAGGVGPGMAVPSTPDTGFFWFFEEDNLEVIIKVLDACDSEFNSYWVFFAVASNVEYVITVTDTEAGISKSYPNNLGEFAPATGDTSAFFTCP
ncbi:MAG: hypothetical protein K8J08_17085 [Thermoanaerobaculia bacterium]|nr:hypothetical protein [Thermoanaerobaculia bacterium]